MLLDCEVLSFEKRAYENKDGEPRVFRSIIIRLENGKLVELGCGKSVDHVAVGKATLRIGLTAWKMQPRFSVEGVE